MAVFKRLSGAVFDLAKGTAELRLSTGAGETKAVKITVDLVNDLIMNLVVFVGKYGEARRQQGLPAEVQILSPVGMTPAIYDQERAVLVFQFHGGAEMPIAIPNSELPKIRARIAELEVLLANPPSKQTAH